MTRVTPSEPRSSREPLEVAELRRLQRTAPELSDAAELQILLFGLQHRVQARLPHPTLEPDDAVRHKALAAGRPALAFDEIAVDWSELRLTVQRVADLLRRFEALDTTDADAALEFSRAGDEFERVVRAWYANTRPAAVGGQDGAPGGDPSAMAADPGALDQILLLAMRPFLGRCAESAQAVLDLSAWSAGYCPLCGGEPEMAVITRAATRRLVCGRCLCQWDFDDFACPYCRNSDPAHITSFASRDRLYRIAACDQCQRYVKAFDARQSDRPFLAGLDSVATLPLDAAAMQRGYRA